MIAFSILILAGVVVCLIWMLDNRLTAILNALHERDGDEHE